MKSRSGDWGESADAADLEPINWSITMVLGQQGVPGLAAGRAWGCEVLGMWGIDASFQNSQREKCTRQQEQHMTTVYSEAQVFLDDSIMGAGHVTAFKRRVWPGPGLEKPFMPLKSELVGLERWLSS